MKHIEIIGWNERQSEPAGSQGLYFLSLVKGNGKDTSDFYERIKKDLVIGEEKAMRFSLVSRHLRWLQGEILTILEASIEDERKLKATKDLVKDKISSKISWLFDLCGRPYEEQDSLAYTE